MSIPHRGGFVPIFFTRRLYAEPMEAGRIANAGIWSAVDALIERAPSLDDLRDHRLQLLAERRWLLTGGAVPASLAADKTLAAALSMAVPGLLGRIASVWEAPKIVLKGPELARRYPDRLLRTAGDIDLLVEDADAAHAALCSSGFAAVGDPRRYVGIHHLQPLVWSELPVSVELHHAPKWIEGLEPPSTAELFRLTVPAQVGVDGFQTLTPAAHAVVVAVHAWSHGPLRSLRDLIDVAILRAEADADEVEHLSECWGVSKVWRTTEGAVEALSLIHI